MKRIAAMFAAGAAALMACGTATAGQPDGSAYNPQPESGMPATAQQNRVTRHEQDGFSTRTGSKEYTLRSPRNAREGRLRLQLRVNQGAVDWRVVDPAGTVRWSGTTSAGERLDDSRAFPQAAAGEWKIQFSMRDASGNYELDWRAE